jgi:hypothetical protein
LTETNNETDETLSLGFGGILEGKIQTNVAGPTALTS